jgi:L-aspartate oxidase
MAMTPALTSMNGRSWNDHYSSNSVASRVYHLYNHRVVHYSNSSTTNGRSSGRTTATSTTTQRLPTLKHPDGHTTNAPMHHRLLVIGSGVAGSAAALIAAETYQIPVTLLFAGSAPTDCNSNWAQGGIIYRNYNPSSNDSAELLAADIHRAGAGLCYDPAVQKVAKEGPERVRQLLLDMSETFANVPFDRNPNNPTELSLCLEASHGAPRILHKADHSGRTITQHITEAARRHPLITLQPNTIVTDLVTVDGLCVGVETIQNQNSNTNTNSHRTGAVTKTEYASYGTVLASGGLAGIYEHSTNPSGFNALGSSVAIARRANVLTQDLEYVQFHPTALCLPNQSRFLLTEALRGEGAILRDGNGTAFAKSYHPDGELAPRDVVARAVFAESQKSNANDGRHNVFLDITHRDPKWLHERFPSICEHLRLNTNLDLAYDRLPIIPAAHYTCGGIHTDLNGCTSLPGLFAAGEAARTGLHGGNRLASTSLLEGLVFGASVADYAGTNDGRQQAKEALQIINTLPNGTTTSYSSVSTSSENLNQDNNTAKQLLQQLKRTMWDYVGVTRTVSGLNMATTILEDLQEQAEEIFQSTKSYEVAAVRDATCAGHAVALAAQANRQSVGAHCIVPDHTQSSATAVVESESDDEEHDLLSAMH